MKMIHIECESHDPLRIPLRKWATLYGRLAGAWKHRGLLPWMGTERTHVSILSAAIWTSRGVALEEVPDQKLKSPKRRSRQSNGRVDLLFDFSDGRYAAETKATRFTISDRRGIPWGQLKERLKNAVDDTKRTPARGRTRLAILFVHVRIDPKFESQIDSRLTDLIHRLVKHRRDIRFRTLVWCFPPAAREYRGNDGYFHPGALLLLAALPK